MEFHDLDLNLLVALDALLQEGNVTRAGNRINLSQSAMSGVLARLRDYFDDDLLTAVGRTLVRTELAENLAQPVRDVLQQIERTVTVKGQFLPAQSTRSFSFVVTDYSSTLLMPIVLRKTAKLAPKVKFNIKFPPERNREVLDEGRTDFVIIPTPLALDNHPKLEIVEDVLTCVVWDDSKFSNEVSRTEYLSSGKIMIRPGWRIGFVDEWVSEQENVEVVAPSAEAACKYVIGSNRIAIVDSRLARYYANWLPLRILNPPFSLPRISRCVQWHRLRDKDPGNTWVRGLLVEAAKEMDSELHHEALAKRGPKK
jgi:LysR family nod box-dependent transcriptional activator